MYDRQILHVQPESIADAPLGAGKTLDLAIAEQVNKDLVVLADARAVPMCKVHQVVHVAVLVGVNSLVDSLLSRERHQL